MNENKSLKNLLIKFLITAIVFYLAKYGGQYLYQNPALFSDSSTHTSTPVTLLITMLALACKIYVIVLVFKILPLLNKWVQLLALGAIYAGTTFFSSPLNSTNSVDISIYPLLIQLLCIVYLAIWFLRLFKKPASEPHVTATAPVHIENVVANTFSSLATILAIIVAVGVALIFLIFFIIGMGV